MKTICMKSLTIAASTSFLSIQIVCILGDFYFAESLVFQTKKLNSFLTIVKIQKPYAYSNNKPKLLIIVNKLPNLKCIK
jgi:hypothetical protein